MLSRRLQQGKIFAMIRMQYNGDNNWRRYQKNAEFDTYPRILKEQHQEGDDPQFIYSNRIKFPREYIPYRAHWNHGLIVSLVLLLFYLDLRLQKIQKLRNNIPNPDILD